MRRLSLPALCFMALAACDSRTISIQGGETDPSADEETARRDGGPATPLADVLRSGAGCQRQADCKADEVCALAGCAAASGTCIKRPSCPTETDEPVCACNGKNYVNDCQRLLAGEALKHQGKCVVDVRVLVDKTTYQAGETVKLQIENHSDLGIRISTCPAVFWQRQESGAWKEHPSRGGCPFVEPATISIAPEKTYSSSLTPPAGGLWRLRLPYTYDPDAGLPGGIPPRGFAATTYSLPFTVMPSRSECEAIDALYQVALKKAKTCKCDMGLCPPNGCQVKAASDLWCGCDSWANDNTELVPIVQSWADTLCPKLPLTGMACPKCQGLVKGACKDGAPSPGGWSTAICAEI